MWPRLQLASIAAAIVVMFGASGLANAQTVDPAAAQIDTFDRSLVAATRSGGGARALSPAIDRVFNIPVMAQFIVGPAWSQLSAADRQSVALALKHYVTARFAHDFSGNDQTIVLTPEVQTRGPDKLVRTRAISPGEEPDQINYRMRAYNDDWRVIDVYYNGVSELTTQRADAAALLRSGGATALAQRLEASAAALH